MYICSHKLNITLSEKQGVEPDQRQDFKTNQDTLNLQTIALNRQILEFQDQKKELEATRIIYEQQNKILKIQQFESNFYSFLNVYLTIKNDLNNKNDNNCFFKSIYEELSNNIDFKDKNPIDCHEYMNNKYLEIFYNHREVLSHYFKTIYRLLNIIDSSSILESDKIFYSKILRSQISEYELIILYYNCNSFYGKKSQSFALKYNIFKHLQILNKIELNKKYYIENTKVANLTYFIEWLMF